MGHKLKQPKTITSRTDFYYYMFRNILLVSVPVFFISALLLSVSHSSADTASSDDITLKLDVACTVSSVVSSPHSALDMHVGQYKADIGNTDISVFCNDNNGYSVYAVGNSNSIDGNTDLISNISSNYNIHTGTNSSSGNSSWAMKLAAGTGSGSETTPPTIVNGYNSYSVVPNNYTLVATRPSSTSMNPDSSVSGSYFSTTYAIYAASTQPAGTYNGKVKYVMVHPDNSTHNTIPDLEAAFAAAGKQKTYQDANGSYYSMQDMDSTICASVTRNGEATATQLIDTRDNKLYWAAKLADDKCWMTENLDLDINGTNTVALTSENTDISADPNVYTSSGIYSDYTVNDGVYTWNAANTATTSGRTITYPEGTSKPTVSGWTNDNIKPYSAEGGDTYYYTSGDSNNDIRYTSLQACKDAGHTETECRRYFAGNYYNWTASVASNNSTNISTNNDKATNSICPKGWRLPNDSTTDNEYNEFGKLLYYGYNITTAASNGTNSVKYNTAADFVRMRSGPLYFMRSGGINGGTLGNSGVDSNYWSSTVASGSNAYYLSFNSTDVWPSRSYYRNLGGSVRCIAR